MGPKKLKLKLLAAKALRAVKPRRNREGPVFPPLPERTRKYRRQVRNRVDAWANDRRARPHGPVDATLDELWSLLGEIGWFDGVVSTSEEDAERGVLEMVVALEEICGAGVEGVFPVLTALGTSALARAGTPECKEELLPRLRRGETKIAVAATESEAGFNLFSIGTSARAEGDEFVLQGTKTYASGFDVADHALIVARTLSRDELEAHGLPKTAGISLFLVDTDNPGIRARPIPTRGERRVGQFDLELQEVRVPRSRLVGARDEGALVLFSAFNVERTLFGASVLGTIRFCLETASRHAGERAVFDDVPVGAYQAIQHPLADAKIRQEAVRHLVYQAAAAQDRGENAGKVAGLANKAKYLGAEAVRKAVDAAMSAMGGRGFDERYGVIQHWESARLLELSPISNHLILNEVAERELDLPRSY